MHRLPDGSAFGIKLCKALQDLCGAGFACFFYVQGFFLAPYLLAHGIAINDHTAEPIVRLAVFFIKWIHGYRKVFEAFFVPFIDRFLLSHMFIKVLILAANDTGDDIAHAVVVAQLLMLIPGSGFSIVCFSSNMSIYLFRLF